MPAANQLYRNVQKKQRIVMGRASMELGPAGSSSQTRLGSCFWHRFLSESHLAKESIGYGLTTFVQESDAFTQQWGLTPRSQICCLHFYIWVLQHATQRSHAHKEEIMSSLHASLLRRCVSEKTFCNKSFFRGRSSGRDRNALLQLLPYLKCKHGAINRFWF